jgi:hypothetical protein
MYLNKTVYELQTVKLFRKYYTIYYNLQYNRIIQPNIITVYTPMVQQNIEYLLDVTHCQGRTEGL